MDGARSEVADSGFELRRNVKDTERGGAWSGYRGLGASRDELFFQLKAIEYALSDEHDADALLN